jgi:uncharacterized membrane protein YheB (UPF0754 family)
MIIGIGILVISLVVGAAIGGFTNFIAIQMLFRPYRQKKLWKWNVPFTPGLIPKRHDEIATQLGELVEEHLFTIESIQEKLHLPSFQEELGQWIQKEVEKGLKSQMTLQQVLELMVPKGQNQTELHESLEKAVVGFVDTKLKALWKEVEVQSVAEILSSLGMSIDDNVEKWAEFILQRGKQFLHSDEGEKALLQFVQQAIDKQGTLGSMLGMFISKERIVEKIRPALDAWLNQPLTKEKVEAQLSSFVHVWLEKRIDELISEETKETIVASLVHQIIQKINIRGWLNQPLHELIVPWKKDDIVSQVPSLVSHLVKWLYGQSPALVKHIGISDMVKKQVLAFPLPRLEKMVRDLAKKELKMITVLGAMLGGTIGIIQALLITFLFT